jgi:DNA polymerase-3 subunit alpha
MAFVTLEDLSGTVESVVFPDCYRSSMLHLAKESAVLVKAQVDVADETVKLLVSEVKPLTLTMAGNGIPSSLVEVRLAGAAASTEGLRRLRELAVQHPGSAVLQVRLRLPEGGEVVIAPAASLTVSADEPFRTAAEAAFGAGSIAVK